MPIYTYKVRDKQGRAVTGDMDAANEKDLTASLKNMGYTPVSVEIKKEQKSILRRDLFSRVRFEDIVIFNRQMSTLLKAGLPLLTGLEAVGEQATSSALKDIFSSVRNDVQSGMSFSESLAKHPKAFSSIYVNMVKAGESSGLLDDVMARLAQMGEYEIEARSRVKSAVRYPIIASVFLLCAFIGLVVGVVPSFEKVFNQFNVELPLPTRMLIGAKTAMLDYWFFTIIAVAGIIILFRKFINTPHGRKWWDNLKLKAPVFGELFIKMGMSRFSKTIAALITSGIPMLQALDLVSDTVGNVVIANGVKNIKEGVNKGEGLAQPMRITGLFTPMVIQMVAIGEETGKLDELLVKVSEYYDQQADYAIKNLTSLIEPILIFVLGITLLFIALGLFLPLWNLITLFRG